MNEAQFKFFLNEVLHLKSLLEETTTPKLENELLKLQIDHLKRENEKQSELLHEEKSKRIKLEGQITQYHKMEVELTAERAGLKKELEYKNKELNDLKLSYSKIEKQLNGEQDKRRVLRKSFGLIHRNLTDNDEETNKAVEEMKNALANWMIKL